MNAPQFEIKELMNLFEKSTVNFYKSDFFHHEILGRLIDRMELVKLSPKNILVLEANPEFSIEKLKIKYPESNIKSCPQVFDHLPFDNNSMDLIFSNLMFHWSPDPQVFFQEISRILKPNALLMFTMLGPDTLKELRFSWMAVDDFPHVHDFYDMHDIGDSLMRTNFAEPVMDMEQLSVNYMSTKALFNDLKNTGSVNIHSQRRKSLIGKKRFQQFLQMLEKSKMDGRYSITFEVIYGHAWGGVERNKGEVEISIKDIKRNSLDT